MPLATMGEIIGPARAAGRGVGAFNVIGIEHAEAIVAGAEAAARPGGAPDQRELRRLARRAGAHRPRLPGRRARGRGAGRGAPGPRVQRGAGPGGGPRSASGRSCTTRPGCPYAENVRATAEVAAWCHDRGIWVEAELGEIGGKNGVHSPLARTDPDEAAGFVAATGVDALAVAVGSSHAMLTRDAVLDLGLIARIRRAVGVPLVLHGSSGVPDRDLAAAIRAGMTKINIATQLNKVFTAAVRDYLSAEPAVVDPRRYGSAGRDAIAPEVARLLGVASSACGPRDRGVEGGRR